MLSSVIEFLVLLSQFSLFGSEAKAEGRKKRKEEILTLLLHTLSQFFESVSKIIIPNNKFQRLWVRKKILEIWCIQVYMNLPFLCITVVCKILLWRSELFVILIAIESSCVVILLMWQSLFWLKYTLVLVAGLNISLEQCPVLDKVLNPFLWKVFKIS